MSKYILFNDDNCKVLKKFKDEIIDLVITSPPYDNLRKYSGYSFDFENLAKELYRVLKVGGVICWVVDDQYEDGGRTLTSFKQGLFFKEIGFKMNDIIIYKKKNPMPVASNNRYRDGFEFVFILSKGYLKTFNPIYDKRNKENGIIRINDSRRQRDGSLKKRIVENVELKEYRIRDNVWEYDIGYLHNSLDRISYNHPATFPEKLVIDCLKTWSNEGDLVMDCFAGSGSVLKNAILLGRKAVGIDISEKFCNLIKQRLKNYGLEEDFDYSNILKG